MDLDRISMRRNDPRMLVSRTIESLLVYVPFMLMQGTVGGMLPAWAAAPWAALVIYFTVTRLTYISVDWVTTRWMADQDGLTVQSGWPQRSRVTVTWREISALDIKQSWIFRILGIHALTAMVGADGKSTLVLDAISSSDVILLAKLHDRAGVVNSSYDSGSVVYRSRFRDFVPIGFTHGQFLLVVPFLIGTGGDVLELFGLEWPALMNWVERWGAGVTVLLVTVLAFGYGTLRAALLYSGYTVYRHPWGYSSSGGMFQRTRREARIEHVVGIRVDRNPLMLLTGTCSVHLVLSNGHGDSKPLPLLPLVAWRHLDRHLVGVLSPLPPKWITRRTSLEPVLALSLGLVMAAVSCHLLGPWAAALVAVLGMMGANVLCVALARNSSTVWIDTGLLVRSLRIIDSSAVRAASYLTWVGPRPWKHGWLGLKVLDRRARVHRIPRVPEALAATFTAP